MTTKNAPTRKPSDGEQSNTSVSGIMEVFVISPIGAEDSDVNKTANLVLNYVIKKAFPANEFNVVRVDHVAQSGKISHQIVQHIHDADLVIADLSGLNPNVFYEIALAHGWRKPIAHIMAKGGNIPFDLQDQRTIFYDLADPSSVDRAIADLRQHGLEAIGGEVVTPVSNFDAFESVRSGSSDGGAIASMLQGVIDRLDLMDRRLANQEARHDFQPRSERNFSSADVDARTAARNETFKALLRLNKSDPGSAKITEIKLVDSSGNTKVVRAGGDPKEDEGDGPSAV